MSRDSISVRGGGRQCPFCRAEVSKDVANRVCADCLTRHHEECWNDYGGCSVFGCGGREYLVQPHGDDESPPSRSRTRRSTRDERPLRAEPPARDRRDERADARATEPARTNGGGRLGTRLATTAVVALVVAGVVFGVQRSMRPSTWDGKKSLYCSKSASYVAKGLNVRMERKTLIHGSRKCTLRIEGSTLVGSTPVTISGDTKLTMIGGRLVGSYRALQLSGKAQAELRDVDVYARHGVYVGGKARLKLIGGRLRGEYAALVVGSGAVVEVSKGTKIEGPIRRSPGGQIIGLPEYERQFRDEQLSKRYSAGACVGLLDCFKQHHQFGQIRATVRGFVNRKGQVEGAEVQGNPSTQVRTCLEGVMKKKSISGYEGAPGTIECRLNGTLLEGGISMMSSSWRFFR